MTRRQVAPRRRRGRYTPEHLLGEEELMDTRTIAIIAVIIAIIVALAVFTSVI